MNREGVGKKIRVLIVEDSAVIREILHHSIGRDARFEVCAVAASAEEALQMFERVAPDVVSLDVWLPGMDGLAATRRIMSQWPTPIVVVSGSAKSPHFRVAMKALEAGALAVLEKPAGSTNLDYETFAGQLCTQLAIMSQVKLVRQYAKQQPSIAGTEARRPQAFAAAGIACSTGGPAALVELLNGLGLAFRLPILLVQHMTVSFLDSFVAWLESNSPFRVAVVEQPQLPTPGRVYLAPPGHHLILDGSLVCAGGGDPVCAERPSGTVLLASMARTLGPNGIGVVLTGMGEDGSAGLLELRRAGGYTIAEDESTAVVYGMPGAAVYLGAVCESLPLQGIAPRLLQLAGSAEAARPAFAPETN